MIRSYKLKIGVYFENQSLQGIDYSDISSGNPGISGTMLQFIILISHLNNYGSIELIQFCKSKSKISHIKEVIVIDELDLITRSLKESIDFLIMRDRENLDFFNKLSKTDLKVIFWGHNYYFTNKIKCVSESKNIVHNVFVSNQMALRYCDTNLRMKSSYIYNMTISPENKSMHNDLTERIDLAYIGSLIPSKGLHEVLKLWNKLSLRLPGSTLHIIGSGQLYDRSDKLGRLGIAEKTYEETLEKYILDTSGKLKKNLVFHGLKNQKEIDEILTTVRIGFINPTGRTETFGVSALDFSRNGIPVITKKINGLPDSVIDKKTGILFFHTKQLPKTVLNLYYKLETVNQFSMNCINHEQKFSHLKILPRWIGLLNELNSSNQQFLFNAKLQYPFINLNIIRVVNSFIRFKLKLRFLPSIVDIESYVWKALNYLKNRSSIG
jgi:glycosyltransferase involved in cell wall biosynthesis